jgi:hypothetical protein
LASSASFDTSGSTVAENNAAKATPVQDPIIGHSEFAGGFTLPVYLDVRGRQYFLEDDGVRLYGLWIYEGEDDSPEVVIVVNLPAAP